jgi:hypothetical protein
MDKVLAWFVRQWNDIKGNVKYAVLLGILYVLGVLLHGLAWWQQSVLALIFVLVVCWGIAQTLKADKAAIRQGEGVPGKPPSMPVPDTTVKDSDPQVTIEFRHDLMCLIPVNRGRMNAANFVCLQSIRLREHWISFPDYAYSLVIGRSENIRPKITRVDGAENDADLYQALFREYASFNDPKLHELPIQLIATYQDDYRNLFETRCELVFSPSDFADLRLGKLTGKIVEIRNPRFKRIAAAI